MNKLFDLKIHIAIDHLYLHYLNYRADLECRAMTRAAEQLIFNLKSKKRVCPMPMYWNRLYALLPNRKIEGSERVPSLPLILAAWDNSSDEEKRQRMREHLIWADDHNALFTIDEYLRGLREDQWHHESR